MKSILKVVFVIIGTIIGAGFASGQEIWIFFNSYGHLGAFGIILACSISGLLIYKIFKIMQKENLTTYAELLEKISNKKILNQAISIIISLFLIISFYIMIAGMSAYFNQEFGVQNWICSIIMSLLCYFTLKRNMKGIVIVNSILIPCLILFILYLGIKNFNYGINNLYINQPNLPWSWIFSSIIYASYNSIVLIPMLVELKEYINTSNKAKVVAILSTLILSIVGICLIYILFRNPNAYKLELPMVEVVKEFGKIYSYLYGGVVVTAIFTSAISAGYGFLTNQVEKKEFTKGDVEKRKNKYYQRLLLIICLIAPIIANFGFSNLVSKLYPMFGILGLIQIVAILKIKCTKSNC